MLVEGALGAFVEALPVGAWSGLSLWTVGDRAARFSSFRSAWSASYFTCASTPSPSRATVIPPRYADPGRTPLTATTTSTPGAGDRAIVPLEDEPFLRLGGTG